MRFEGTHRIRWKGAVSGPFPATVIIDMLRAGEVSLAHSVEADGRWITVREFLRGTHPRSESATSAMAGTETREADRQDDVAAGRRTSDDSIERAVREGYLWCGSTFLLPPAFGLLVWLWVLAVPETQPLSRFVLLAFCSFVGSLLPVAMVRRVGSVLDHEGLGELRQAQGRLSVMLAVLGLAFWLVMFWFLKGGS
ncbi:MAG: hypothetical protein ACKOQ9_09175 [Verrucomicrobiota bacterium]